MLLRCESLEPPMSQLGQNRPKADVRVESDLPPCVDGSELARAFFTSAALVGAAMCLACFRGSHDRWP
jgi:hypothetical protein